MNVSTFDEKKIKELVINSDEYLQKYISAITRIATNWKNIVDKAVTKLSQLSKENKSLKAENELLKDENEKLKEKVEAIEDYEKLYEGLCK